MTHWRLARAAARMTATDCALHMPVPTENIRTACVTHAGMDPTHFWTSVECVPSTYPYCDRQTRSPGFHAQMSPSAVPCRSWSGRNDFLITNSLQNVPFTHLHVPECVAEHFIVHTRIDDYCHLVPMKMFAQMQRRLG